MASRTTYTNRGITVLATTLPAKADRLAEAIARRGEALVKENIERMKVIDTGAGLGSVASEKQGEALYLLYVGMFYMFFQNYGTWKLAARPFWEPALLQLKNEVPALARGMLTP